jgi:hypothetical protein
LNVILLNVILLNVILLNVILLNVILLNVILLNVTNTLAYHDAKEITAVKHFVSTVIKRTKCF